MALLDMLAPEVLLFEQLGALGGLASPLVLVLLFHMLEKLFFNSFIRRPATKLSDVDRMGF
jgi:hypothetical protein